MRAHAFTRCFILPVLLLIAGPAWAEDWPQFRGPRRDGTWNDTGLLKSFPAGGLTIRWRAPVGGGWASPVVAQGRVYVADVELRKPAAKERVLCFDEVTGKPLWTFAYDVTYPEWAFVPGQGGGPTATPVVAGGRIFAVGINGHVHCLDARSGVVVWERNLAKTYEVRDQGCRPSPLIEGNLLIVFTGAKPDAGVVALDKDSGREIWKALNEPASSSSPMVITAGGQRQLIVWSDSSVTSLNLATGETWWREPMVTSNNDSIPTPVAQKNRLLISGLMFELDASRPAATVLWPTNRAPAKRLLSNTSSPMLRGDHIYSAMSSGELVCLDAGTGALVWRTNTVTLLKPGASIHLTSTRDAVFLFTDQGNLIRAQLTPQGYREEGRARIIEPLTPFSGRNCAWPPPAFANRHVFARNEKELVCASLAGADLEEHRPSKP
ncbi:MAG: PQQ-binding-like beta-propeller repeat protein [Verrucomicrobiota bacterium]